jgi:hypothetical protein
MYWKSKAFLLILFKLNVSPLCLQISLLWVRLQQAFVYLSESVFLTTQTVGTHFHSSNPLQAVIFYWAEICRASLFFLVLLPSLTLFPTNKLSSPTPGVGFFFIQLYVYSVSRAVFF